MPRSLFRKEAIDAQREKFLGEASVAQPVRLWVFTATACTVALIAVAVAVWGQYTRRERVQGYLASAVGAADVRMPDAGTLAEVMVKEGDVVTAGTVLARLTFDRSGTNDASGNETVLREMSSRAAGLVGKRQDTERLVQQDIEQQKKRIANLKDEVRQVDGEIALQSQRLGQSRQLRDKWLDLKKDGYANDYYLLRYESEVKDQEIKVQALQRQRASIAKDLGAAESDLPSLALRGKAQVESVRQQESELAQSVALQNSRHEQDVKREMVVTAPIDGTVTNIAQSRGQTVAADSRFATLLPKNSPLHAELLVPTRAIGFVKPGQKVLMRYEAFPYERFGQYAGKVESVGKDVWTQGASLGPLSVREPVYRIVVELDRQEIATNDQSFPLRAGMVVNADLLLEKRTLLEWLFQPVMQLRRRMSTATS
jgi:membrane fusion protein